MVRWSWRMFRKEWRQQTLVLSLITLAVAASVAGSAMAMNAAATTQPAFGTATALARIDVADPAAAKEALATATARFGTTEAIGHTFVPIPGVPLPLDVRAQDPHGTYGHPQLGLLEGRYPTKAGEVALAAPVAELLDVGIGDRLDLAGRRHRVVGRVENPSRLDDAFALVAPQRWTDATSVTLLFERPGEDGASAAPGAGDRRDEAGATPMPVMVRGSNGPVAALVLVAVALAMTLVGLIAAAAFVVLAQRRQRQLGLLAAIGATRRHLRMVVVAHGAIVGIVAAAIGGLLGILGWIAAAPAVESAARHRIDRLDLPWAVIACCLALAVLMSVLAAWWPARRVARIPVIAALSGRPPEPTPVHRSTAVAVVLLGGGVWAIATALPEGDRVNPPLLMAGVIAVAIGTVFVAPAAVRLVALPARRLPLPSRLAVRDLARFQSRAASALAAIAFAVGLSVTITAVAQANEYRADEGNLPSNQMVVRQPMEGGPLRVQRVDGDEHIDALDAKAAAVAAAIPGAEVLPLDVAMPADGDAGPVEPISQAIETGASSWRGLGTPVVATPEILARYDIDPASIDPDAELLTSDDRAVVLLDTSVRSDPAATKVQHVDLPTYFAAPHALVTEAALEAHGWERQRDSWLVTSSRPLTTEQIRAAREAAGAQGMTIETRISQDSLAAFRTIVATVGVLLGQAIVAMTVGLIRSESARDVRTLTATGAGSRSRRAITASAAGALATLGVVLGAGGAYVALVAGYHADLGELVPLPWPQLVATAIGLPLLATAAGWLLAGREPSGFSRQTFD
jgi:putative ABC transport system permease protein